MSIRSSNGDTIWHLPYLVALIYQCKNVETSLGFSSDNMVKAKQKTACTIITCFTMILVLSVLKIKQHQNYDPYHTSPSPILTRVRSRNILESLANWIRWRHILAYLPSHFGIFGFKCTVCKNTKQRVPQREIFHVAFLKIRQGVITLSLK